MSEKLVQNSESLVDLTKLLSSTTTTRTGQNFDLKTSININLLPNLNDGYLYSASFDIYVSLQ